MSPLQQHSDSAVSSSSFLLALRRRPSWAGVGASVLIITTLTLGLHWRAAHSSTRDFREPMPVATLSFVLQDAFSNTSSYLGLVEAARTSNLSFEIPGKLNHILVEEGATVAAGEIVASLENSALQARRDVTLAALRGTEVELELSKLQFQRQKNLVAKGSVSQAVFDDTRLRVQALRAKLESSQAQLRSIEIDLDKAQLHAPFAGTVANRFIDEGTVIAPGVPVLRLLASTAFKAHIGISPIQSESLSIGEDYPLVLRGVTLQAKLIAVRPDVDPATRSAQAVFLLPREARALNGEPIQLLLTEDREARGGWIPLSAMMEGSRGLWSVLRVDHLNGDVRVVREAVQVLHVDGDRAFVSGTLPDGAIVVASGINRLAPGSMVQLVGDK